MKSDEEFIAGIYAKAEAYQTEHGRREESNVIRISSFQRKIKKVSTYAAGVAACFACGIAVYLGTNIGKDTNDSNKALESRKVQGDEIQPMTIDSNPVDDGIVSQPDVTVNYLHCIITKVMDQDGISHINATVDGGETVTLLVPTENRSKLIDEGNEVVLSVYKADASDSYSIAINQDVYVYCGMENGEKVFTSENQVELRESDLKEAE